MFLIDGPESVDSDSFVQAAHQRIWLHTGYACRVPDVHQASPQCACERVAQVPECRAQIDEDLQKVRIAGEQLAYFPVAANRVSHRTAASRCTAHQTPVYACDYADKVDSIDSRGHVPVPTGP